MRAASGPTFADRLWGLLRLKCPVCRKGAIFAGTVTMHKQCPACRYVFTREPGYFLGAVAVGYFLGVAFVVALSFAVRAGFPTRDWEWCFLVGIVLYLPFTPMVFRYARGIWMYFDNLLDPPAN